MRYTNKEKTVIDYLKKKITATKKELCLKLKISPATVIRALKKYDYYSSCNKNSDYYVLADIPDFDENGLWVKDDICFSAQKTIIKTLIVMIDNSEKGLTADKLAKLLNTNPHNILSRLCRTNRINKCNEQHKAIYLSADSKKRKSQTTLHRKHLRELKLKLKLELEEENKNCLKNRFPSGLKKQNVLAILVEIIVNSEASIASISRKLQHKGIEINTKDIRQVIEFYSLKKNGNR